MSLPTSRILSGLQSHLTLSPEGGLRSAVMRRLRLAACRSCWQFFSFSFFFCFYISILALSSNPPCIFMPPSSGNELWYAHENDIKKKKGLQDWFDPGGGGCTKQSCEPLLTVANTTSYLSYRVLQKLYEVAWAVQIISKSSGFSV